MQIEMKGIDKAFSTVKVLQNACLEIRDGEVHALMGENGAGKSTLMKILTGVYKRDAGVVKVDGQEVEFKHPREAEKAGIVFIYQENNAIPDLTVQENMFLGKEIKNALGYLNKAQMNKECEAILKRLGSSIKPSQVMSQLSVGQQQMVEIAKALMAEAKVIIMDEPTAALSASETEILFSVIRQLKQQGVSIVYISHRMEEIFLLCDRVTVLRDGEYIGTRPIAETDMQELVRMMIGREIGEQYPERKHQIGEIKFVVEQLTHPSYFQDINFDVRAGEVLGVYGLMGAGRTEIMHAIFGDMHGVTGTVKIDGKAIQIKNPKQAKNQGIGFITEDRKVEGLLLEDSIQRNISLNNIEQIVDHGFIINRHKEINLSESYVQDLRIRCSNRHQLCVELSGGNQQKVVFAKWIANHPKVLILDEPTRGVDVGAKKEIYQLINVLAEQGAGVIFVSSDMPEVLGMSDRIMVVREGKVSGFLQRAEADQEKIMTLAAGGEVA